MGNMIIRTWDNFWHPDLNPVPYGETTFDPHFGFEGKREERVMIATEQELRACLIPKEKWDYCAHLLLDLERCKADVFPFVWNCRKEVDAYNMCQLNDHMLRMKEYERERRLLHRKKRLEEKEAAAA